MVCVSVPTDSCGSVEAHSTVATLQCTHSCTHTACVRPITPVEIWCSKCYSSKMQESCKLLKLRYRNIVLTSTFKGSCEICYTITYILPLWSALQISPDGMSYQQVFPRQRKIPKWFPPSSTIVTLRRYTRANSPQNGTDMRVTRRIKGGEGSLGGG